MSLKGEVAMTHGKGSYGRVARPRARIFVMLAFSSVLVVGGLVAPIAHASPGLVTEDLTGPLTPTDLANELSGAGVTVSNVTFTGEEIAGGKFGGGTGIVGFESGIILSSGDVANVIGPNVEDGKTTSHGGPGDTDLTALSGVPTLDAAVLEFDFTPDKSQVAFNFVFASDEYNEYVHSAYNDVFGFFVNGTNCATVGGDPVSINTINNGNPHNTDPREHPDLYRNNDLQDGGGSIDTEMDGLTVVLTCHANVTQNATNHMKLAIADGSDTILDSDVFLQTGSLTTDAAAPSCRLTARRPGPPAQIDITFQDTGSGLASIVTKSAVNATISIPAFSQATNNPVVVTATKTNQSQISRVGLEARDVAGNLTRCTASGVIPF
jgi:hypothetical protein